MAKVAVIIPCFNLGRYINEALDSVLNQTFQDLEVIIVDDGSSDQETIKIIDEIQNSRVRIIRTQNQGVSAARNTGVRNADAKYIVCLDADDTLHPQFIEKTTQLLDMDKLKRLGFVSTWFFLFGKQRWLVETEDYNKYKFAFSNKAHVSSMFRKECWEQVGGFYEKRRLFFEDWYFWLSIIDIGYQCKVIKEPLYNYRIRDESRFSTLEREAKQLYPLMVEKRPVFFFKAWIYWISTTPVILCKHIIKKLPSTYASSGNRFSHLLRVIRSVELIAPYKKFFSLSRALFYHSIPKICQSHFPPLNRNSH